MSTKAHNGARKIEPVRFTFDTGFGEAQEEHDPLPALEQKWRQKADDAAKTAYDRGVADGKEAGQLVAVAGMEAQILAMLKSIDSRMDLLFTSHDEVRRDMERQAAELALSVARAMAPAAMARFPFDELDQMIQRCLDEVRGEAPLCIMVAPMLVEPLSQRLAGLDGGAAAAGNIAVRPDPALGPGDARIEWDEAGLVFDQARILAEVEASFERFMKSLEPRHSATADEEGI